MTVLPSQAGSRLIIGWADDCHKAKMSVPNFMVEYGMGSRQWQSGDFGEQLQWGQVA
jgi:hypothetical protein